jgi:hypothetical protein
MRSCRIGVTRLSRTRSSISSLVPRLICCAGCPPLRAVAAAALPAAAACLIAALAVVVISLEMAPFKMMYPVHAPHAS